MATLNIVYTVTYYLESHNAISMYLMSRFFVPTKVNLIVWIFIKYPHLHLVKIYIHICIAFGNYE